MRELGKEDTKMPNSDTQKKKTFLIDSNEIESVSKDDIKDVISKVDLQAIIYDAEIIVSDTTTSYTEETKNALVTSLASAKSTIIDETATAEEYDEKRVALENAIDGLVKS